MTDVKDALINFTEDRRAHSISFFASTPTSGLHHDQLAVLLEMVRSRERNARLCLHQSPGDQFHDMIICERRGHYCRPHKHLCKEETCHIIRGRAGVIVFYDDGSIRDAFVMATDACVVCRIGKNEWHTVIALSPEIVYHESKPGPFMPQEDAVPAPWSPDGSNVTRAATFVKNLSEQFGAG